MTAARRLAQFRAALVAFVVMTVLLICVAEPTIHQIADGWRPELSIAIVALLILGVWLVSFVVMLVAEEKRLYVIRRKAGVR